MSVWQMGQLVVVTCLLTTGQVLFKRGASSAERVTSVGSLVSLFISPTIVGALCLYAVTTVLWVFTLQQVPLTRAYPFMALGFVLVPLAAMVFLGESMSLRYAGGMVLILLGLYLTAAPH